MDDAARAELAELRRRAFGLHPDIESDPAATARLVDLEQLVLIEHAASVSAVNSARFSTDEVAPSIWGEHVLPTSQAELVSSMTGDEAPVDPVSRGPRPRRRDGWALAATAALVATAVVVATPATPPTLAEGGVTIEATNDAYSLARDRDAEVLLDIPFGPWIDTSTSDADVVWLFPTSDRIEWTVPLGEYYGWDIWVAGTDDIPRREHCILAVHGEVAKGRCIPAGLRPFSALLVTLPYRAIEADERPEGFTPDHRIGFWWRADDSVTVLLGSVNDER